MKLNGLQKTSLIDFPEKICCVVFLKKCNFRCPFCFNPDLVKETKGLGEISEKEFFKFLQTRKGLLDGVCITGGEPTLNPELIDFIKKIKKEGFLVKLDSNGSHPELLKKLLNAKLLDFIAMDVKGEIEKYDEITNCKVNKKAIKESIELIKNSGIDYEFRTTIVPKFLKEKDLMQIAEELKGAKKFVLQQFRNNCEMLDNSMQKVSPYSAEKLKVFCEKIKPFFKVCEIRGI